MAGVLLLKKFQEPKCTLCSPCTVYTQFQSKGLSAFLELVCILNFNEHEQYVLAFLVSYMLIIPISGMQSTLHILYLSNFAYKYIGVVGIKGSNIRSSITSFCQLYYLYRARPQQVISL